MDKPAIKKFAVWARNKLIADTKYRAGLVGVTETAVAEPLPQSNETVQFFDVGLPQPYRIEGDAVTQRQRFVAELNKETAKQGSYTAAYQTVVDKVAYTWFNRLIAVRYMEVNDLLPSRTRVLSSADGRAEPQIVTSPFDAVLDYTPAEQQQIVNLKNDNKLDEAFRLLFLKQCAALGDCLPRLFEQVDDYMPLLLALSFTDKDGVVCHLVNDIPESDWQDAVQIVGWLYQYYNTEPKEQVFANLKKNIKISAENIPAATQLFTPDWIVRYMVENSLGRLWSEGHPDFDKSEWKYYLDEAPQEPQVAQQLAELRKGYAALTPEDIKCIDPSMGSGHILAYLFDVLMQIYRSAGYTDRDAAASIVEHNLYGLDIDDRAAQMAYFVVMMKGCHYDSRFLRRHLNPHVYAIQESGELTADALGRLGKQESTARALLDGFKNAKEYGSILQPKVTLAELDALQEQLREVDGASDMGSFTDQFVAGQLLRVLCPLVEQARMLVQKYDVVVTNPPYMGGSGMDARLSDYVKKVYPDSKSDLFAVFIERCAQMDKRDGYQAMITQPSLLFLTSFEKLRERIISQQSICSLLHMGRGIFGIDFGSTSFVIRNSYAKGYKGEYFRLHERTFQYIEPTDIAGLFLNAKNSHDYSYDFALYDTGVGIVEQPESIKKKKVYFETAQDNFSKIPGSPVAYWVSNQFIMTFEIGTSLSKIAPTRKGMFTGNNDLWLKLWFEVDNTKFCKTFMPYNKGGEYRKWYGNNDYVVNWCSNGESIANYKGSGNISTKLFFKPCLTWSLVTSYKPSFRAITDCYHVMGDAGPIVVTNRENNNYILGLLNSKYAENVAYLIAPTINFSNGAAGAIPVIFNENKQKNIDSLVENNINLSKSDWDSFETSWDFKRHPLV